MKNLYNIKKCAVLLLSLDLEKANSVVKLLSNEEIDIITTVMLQLNSFDFEIFSVVMLELKNYFKELKSFYNVNQKRVSSLLNVSLGKKKGEKMLERSLLKNSFEKNIFFLNRFSPRKIFLFIKSENFRIISIILIFLNKELSKSVISFFLKKEQEEIINQMKNFQEIDFFALSKLNKILSDLLFSNKNNNTINNSIRSSKDFLFFLQKKKNLI